MSSLHLPTSILQDFSYSVDENKASEDAVLTMHVVGASTSAQSRGLDQFPGTSNYFIGNDPKQWRIGVPNYAKVQYKNVYPGIDLVYYGNENQLEYDFVVAPGSQPEQIRIAYETRSSTESQLEPPTLDATGDVVVDVHGRKLRFRKPVVYQSAPRTGDRTSVEGRYVLRADNQIGFEIGNYDRTKPLVIDPTLLYSSYLGGNAFDQGFGVVLDGAGNIYVAGTTSSTSGFPLLNPAQGTEGGGMDAFVTKFDPTGRNLIYSTYLGGSLDELCEGIALDSAGNAYITGGTKSGNFPTTTGVLQTTFASKEPTGTGQSAFVAEFDPSGKLLFSTFLGGNGIDQGFGIAVDSSGVYVAGDTTSTNFPTKNAFRGTVIGPRDAFASKLSLNGSQLLYSTYIGGVGGDTIAYTTTVDSSQSQYIAGLTLSTSYPTKNPFQSQNNSGTNGTVFVTKFTPDGSTLVYSTYLGGTGSQSAGNMTVDSAGSVYVTGGTSSSDFPTKNPFQAQLAAQPAGHFDVFVSKFDPTGSALVYSTYLGGNDYDFGDGIAVDSQGNAHVAGYSLSTNFPTTPNAFQAKTGGNWDGIAFELNSTGNILIFASYLGGSGLDTANPIALDSVGNAYVSGHTVSPTATPNVDDFPTRNNPLQPNYGGDPADAYLAIISAVPTFPLTVTVSGAAMGDLVTSTPTGISCGANCSETFLGGTQVSLAAAIANGSSFSGWSGACSGTGACNLTMNAAEAVTANFSAASFHLNPAQSSLTIQPGGQASTTITISASSSPGSPVNLACAVTGPSPMPTCALNPTSVTPGPTGATSTLTISVPSSARLMPLFGRRTAWTYAIWLPIGLVGIGLADARKPRSRHWIGFVLLLLLLGFAGGCSGKSGTTGPAPNNYTVTVTGTSGSAQATTQVAVTVP